MDIEKLGKRIKNIRKLRKMTREQLAYRAGVSHSLLEKIENGRIITSPRITTLMKIAEGLNVSLEDILKDTTPVG